VTSAINEMRIAGLVLAVAMCCGATDASAQLYLNITGGNAPARQRTSTGNRRTWNGRPWRGRNWKPDWESRYIGHQRWRLRIKPRAGHSVIQSRLGQRGRRRSQSRRRFAFIRPGRPVIACQLHHQHPDGFGQRPRAIGNDFGDESPRQAKAEHQCRGHFIEWPQRGRGPEDHSRRKSLNLFAALKRYLRSRQLPLSRSVASIAVPVGRAARKVGLQARAMIYCSP
jgi:hypothetical protein